MKEEEKYFIERYDCRSDEWELLKVKLTESFPYFNLFHTFPMLLTSTHKNPESPKKDTPQYSVTLTREQLLI